MQLFTTTDPRTRFALTWAAYGALFGVVFSFATLLWISATPMQGNGFLLDLLFFLIFVFGVAVPIIGVYALIGYGAALLAMDISAHFDWRTASKGFKPAE